MDRAARRNVARDTYTLRHWRTSGLADEANRKSNIADRAAQCREAVKIMAKATVDGGRMGLRGRGLATFTCGRLSDYWAKWEPRTRVISRILRELKA